MATTGARIVVYAGNKATLRYTITDRDAVPVSGVYPPLNLSAFAAPGRIQFAISRGSASRYSTEADVQKSNDVSSEVEVQDAANGIVDVKLIGTDTAALVGDFYRELELVDVSGETVVVEVGEIEIRRNVVNT